MGRHCRCCYTSRFFKLQNAVLCFFFYLRSDSGGGGQPQKKFHCCRGVSQSDKRTWTKNILDIMWFIVTASHPCFFYSLILFLLHQIRAYEAVWCSHNTLLFTLTQVGQQTDALMTTLFKQMSCSTQNQVFHGWQNRSSNWTHSGYLGDRFYSSLFPCVSTHTRLVLV